MFKFFSGLILAYLVPLVVTVAALLATPDMRHSAFRATIELPEFAFKIMLRKSLFARDYADARLWLERQLALVNWVGGSRSAMLPGLIANTKFVMDGTYFNQHFVSLRPYLTKLVEIFPNVYEARVWLARSLAQSNPETAIPHLTEAVKLIPSDDRAYRVAIGALVRSNKLDEVRFWCTRYKQARFGGPRPYDRNTLFEGLGLRKLALETNGKEAPPYVVGHHGVQFGKLTDYNFSFPKSITSETLVLHLGLLPGVKIQIGGLTLYGANGRQDIPSSSLLLLPSGAFATSEDTFITVSSLGESIGIALNGKRFPPFDRVSLSARLERSAIALENLCGQAQKSDS